MAIKFHQQLIADTEAELLAITNIDEGQIGYAKDTNKLYRWDGAAWTVSVASTIVGITGTLAEFNTALTGADFATGGGTASGTNTGDQTTIVGITGTKAQFDTAVTDDNFLYTSAFSGLAKITVGTGTPAAPTTGDLWVDSN